MPVLEQDAMNAGKGFIEHQGIKGMRWGFRKRDNKSSSSSSSSSTESSGAGTSTKKDRKNAVKNRRKLSTSELQTRVNRNQLEKQLKESTAENLAPKRTAVKKALGSAAKTVATAALPGLASYAGRKFINKFAKNEALANEVFPPKTKKGKGTKEAGEGAVEELLKTVGTRGLPTFKQSATPRS